MAERLTECIDSHLLDNGEMVKEYSLNSKIKLNHFSCMDIPNAVYDKLGELEDILEKYGIESVEELDKKIDDFTNFMKGNKFETIEDLQNALNGKFIEVFDEKNKIWQDMVKNLTKTEKDRDTWEKACELASETLKQVMGKPLWIGGNITAPEVKDTEYFYQQAKRKGMMSRKILTIGQAIDILPQKEQIHCFINAGFGLVGADWNKEKVIETLKDAEVVEIGGEQCKALKHALVCIPKNAKMQSDLYFFESRVDKIDYYEELLGEQQ